MAQVAFWSIVHGQPANTANMVALSTIVGFEYDLPTLLAQTHFARSTLETAFQKSHDLSPGNMYNFTEHGIDALDVLAKSRMLKPESIRDNAISIIKGRLDLLVGTSKPDEERYERLESVIQPIFREAQRVYRTVFLDVHSGTRNNLTNAILEDSNLIVVSLNQNLRVLEKFFAKEDWPDALNHKPYVLLLGQYDPDSKYTLMNIKRYFDVKVPIYAIPYCSDYRDALNDMNVYDFFKRNRNLDKKEQNSYFFNELRKTARSILEAIEVNTALTFIGGR